MSRGGLSNWVLFSFPDELVIVDTGMTPALKAGALAGALSQLHVVGEIVLERMAEDYRRSGARNLHAWCAELRAKTKSTVWCKGAELLGVRLHRRALAHQLYVTVPDGEHKFNLINRGEVDRAASLLQQRLGARFEVSSTTVFGFCQRYAPFLMT
jgi:hypothetical protein